MIQYQNIYQKARELTGYTQETAAELLHISVESVRAYETDKRRPPDHLVVMMANLYDFPYLAYQHLAASPLGDLLPRVEPLRLQQATMKLFRLLRGFARDQRTEQLLAIAEDGQIDDVERPEYEKIMEELRAIIAIALSVELAE